MIETVRREYLDQTLFWNEDDLHRKLNDFMGYYNNHRVHASLDGEIPTGSGKNSSSGFADLPDFNWKSFCRGLVQLPVPA